MNSNLAFSSPVLLNCTHQSLSTRYSCSPKRVAHQPRRSNRTHWYAVAAPPKPSTTRLSPQVEAFLSRAHEGDPLKGLERAEEAFNKWKSGPREVKPIVHDEQHLLDDATPPEFDVVVAGGTLGIFYACALAARGQRVAVVERGRIAGRKQEWNISRNELQALVREGVLTQTEIEGAIVNEFSAGSRIAFPDAKSDRNALEALNVRGVLNLGVDPSMLVAAARKRFLKLSGQAFEFSSLERVGLRENSVRLTLRSQNVLRMGDGALGAGGTGFSAESAVESSTRTIRARLLVDAMGSFSPIAAQSRDGAQPDGCCITVGACLSGDFDENNSSDLLCAIDGVKNGTQRFWEAFPAGREQNRRTTYMFSYGRCDNERETLANALEDYVRLMPGYQGISLSDVEVERVLFGFFPCYRDSPAPVTFDRIVPVGDAAGHQSPVSFGGFAACMRHLGRISDALDEALAVENDALLKRDELQRLQFYNPSLKVAWLFNTFMSVQKERFSSGNDFAITDLLLSNMKAMESLGPKVQTPFLQDVVRAGGLLRTLTLMVVRDPVLALKTMRFAAPTEFLAFFQHLAALVLFTLQMPVACAAQALLTSTKLSAETRWRLNRWFDALKYGSGLDHKV